MKAIQLISKGFDQFKQVNLPNLEPRAGEVLIRQTAASLNYLDVPVAMGDLPWAKFPLVPVADSAGVVVSVGDGVSDWKIGDRVTPHFMPAWLAGPINAHAVTHLRGVTISGALAEHAVLPSASLVATPAHLTDAQAATLPIAATTAWNAMKKAAVRPGSTVLILGTGGVASFLLLFAKAAGARVLVLSSSAEKLATVLAAGADVGINRTTHPEWQKEVLEQTGGKGVDLVLETVGASTFPKSLESVAFGGTIFVIGFLGGQQLQFDLLQVVGKAVQVIGNNTGSVQDLREAAAAIDQCKLIPMVGRIYPLADIADAYRELQAGKHLGKLAITLDFKNN